MTRTIYTSTEDQSFYITNAEGGLMYGKDPYFDLINRETGRALTMSLSRTAGELGDGTDGENYFYIHGQGEAYLTDAPEALAYLFIEMMNAKDKLDNLSAGLDEDGDEEIDEDERVYAEMSATDDLISALDGLDEDGCKMIWDAILADYPDIKTYSADRC